MSAPPRADLLLEVLDATRTLRDEIAGLRVEVAGLRSAVDRTKPRQRDLSLEDRRALARLLPVLVAQIGPDVGFKVWELLDITGTRGIAAADMRIALGKLTAHQLGKLLRRAADAGVTVAGLRVEAAGRDGAGGKWRCVADPSPFSP